MIETLLTSCQGGPEFKDLTFCKFEKKWVTLFCCLNRLDEERTWTIRPPKEVINAIFMYCLPKPKELIDHIPLQTLSRLNTMIHVHYRQYIVHALIERHMNQLKHVLTSKVLIKKTNRTPMQMAQARGHEEATLLLNPKVIPHVKKIMFEKYEKLLNKKTE